MVDLDEHEARRIFDLLDDVKADYPWFLNTVARVLNRRRAECIYILRLHVRVNVHDVHVCFPFHWDGRSGKIILCKSHPI
jgi:hypothetical protein